MNLSKTASSSKKLFLSSRQTSCKKYVLQENTINHFSSIIDFFLAICFLSFNNRDKSRLYELLLGFDKTLFSI